MIYSVDFKEVVGKISHIETAKYLRNLGWKEIFVDKGRVIVFQLENQMGFFQIDLPMSRQLPDYKRAMYSAVETLALSADKSVEQIILELLNPLSDILRLRVNGPSTKDGSIFMEDAISLYGNAKKLLTATAMDIIRPRLLHTGPPPANITDFVSKCRFGQTEIGSYVVSVVCPFARLDTNEMVQLTLHADEKECAESITRRVVNKLITSVGMVKEAIHKGHLENVINQYAETENCMSANFLEALNGTSICREGYSLDLAISTHLLSG